MKHKAEGECANNRKLGWLMIDPAKLKEWARLAERATGGPWLHDESISLSKVVTEARGEEPPYEWDYIAHDVLSEDDAAFIAASREAVPALIEALVQEVARRRRLELVAIAGGIAIRAPHDKGIIIVFPGETQEEFASILRLIDSGDLYGEARRELGLED